MVGCPCPDFYDRERRARIEGLPWDFCQELLKRGSTLMAIRKKIAYRLRSPREVHRQLKQFLLQAGFLSSSCFYGYVTTSLGPMLPEFTVAPTPLITCVIWPLPPRNTVARSFTEIPL